MAIGVFLLGLWLASCGQSAVVGPPGEGHFPATFPPYPNHATGVGSAVSLFLEGTQ